MNVKAQQVSSPANSQLKLSDSVHVASSSSKRTVRVSVDGTAMEESPGTTGVPVRLDRRWPS